MGTVNTTSAKPGPTELRLPIDAAAAPFAYLDAQGCLALQVALSGGGHARLVLSSDDARSWAGEAFAAISTAYRGATGDPLSEQELATLPLPGAYLSRPGLHLCAEGEHPAIMRFHLVVDVAGECLSEGALRAALVEGLKERFKVDRVGVAAAFAISGRPS